jgi:hypothetical protein
MATEEKKIKFTGDASGLISEMQKITNRAKSMSAEIFNDATKYSNNSNRQFGFVQDTISSKERDLNLRYQQTKYSANDYYVNKIKSANTPEEKSKVEQMRKNQMLELKKERDAEKIQLQTLKDILGAIKDSSKQEIAENKKAVEQNVKEYERALKRGDTSGYSDEEKMKLSYQKSLLDEGKAKQVTEKGGWLETFKGVLAAEAVKSIMAGFGNAAKGVVGAESGEKMLSAALRAVPWGGDFASSVYERHIDQQLKAQKETFKLESYVGKGKTPYSYNLADTWEEQDVLSNIPSSVNNYGATMGIPNMVESQIEEHRKKKKTNTTALVKTKTGRSVWEELGYSNPDRDAFALQFAQSSGGKYNDFKEAYKLAAISRGKFGGDTSALMGMASTNRLTQGELVEQVGSVIKALQSKGEIGEGKSNYALNNVINTQNQLVSSLSTQKEFISRDALMRTQLNLGDLGGGWGLNDPRQMQNIMSLNGMMTGGNDYMQAMQYGALKKMNPNADMYSMYEMRQQGLAGDKGFDYLKTMIDQAKASGGDDKQLAMYMSAGIPELKGMPVETIRKLLNVKDLNKETAKQNLSPEEYDALTKEGISRTTYKEKDIAEISNSFEKGATDGVIKAAEIFARTVVEKIDAVMNDKGYYTAKENITK